MKNKKVLYKTHLMDGTGELGLSVLCNCVHVYLYHILVPGTLKKRVTFIVCNLESDLKGIRNYRKSFQITNMITIKVLTSDECKNMLSK